MPNKTNKYRAYKSPDELLKDFRLRFGNVPIWILPKDGTCARWQITGFDADGDAWLGDFYCSLESLFNMYTYENGTVVGTLYNKEM